MRMVVQAGHQPPHRREDALARLGVEAGGGLVEQQDRGVADHRAGDRDTLALSAGQQLPLVPDRHVVALGQRGDEGVGVSGARGRD